MGFAPTEKTRRSTAHQGNQLEVFFRLAAGNAATVVKALLRAMPE